MNEQRHVISLFANDIMIYNLFYQLTENVVCTQDIK